MLLSACQIDDINAQHNTYVATGHYIHCSASLRRMMAASIISLAVREPVIPG